MNPNIPQDNQNVPNHPNYFAVIPADVRYCKDLEPSAKLLYGEITALCNREGYCWASNSYFADLYNVDERTITRWLTSLKDKEFICIQTIKKGMYWDRKIYLNKDCFTKGQKCPDRSDKNVPSEQTKMSTEYNIVNSTDLKGIVLETQPSKEGTMEKSKYPLRKEQQITFSFLKDLQLECDDNTLIILIRTFEEQKILDAISHLKHEIEKGTKFKKPKIAMLRAILNGKISPLSKRAIVNKKTTVKAKIDLNWDSLKIYEKHCVCEKSQKDVSFDLPKDEFNKIMRDLIKLSMEI